MGALRLVIVLVIAAASAVGLALVVRHMTASRPAAAMAATPPPRPSVRVMVAKRDMKIGERLQPEDIAWQAWPQGAVNPAFITGGPATPKPNLAQKAESAIEIAIASDPAVQQVAGALVRDTIMANEPISQRKLVKGGMGGFMAVKLPAGMRAMSTPVTMETGVGGFILPGDHVDVIESVKVTANGDMHGGPSQPAQSKVILRNLTVLAIDQAAEPKSGAASLVGTTATLEVPAADIDILAKAREEGQLQLALRSYEDMSGPQGAVQAPAPARAAQVRVAREDISVRVYRGGKVSEVRVP